MRAEICKENYKTLLLIDGIKSVAVLHDLLQILKEIAFCIRLNLRLISLFIFLFSTFYKRVLNQENSIMEIYPLCGIFWLILNLKDYTVCHLVAGDQEVGESEEGEEREVLVCHVVWYYELLIHQHQHFGGDEEKLLRQQFRLHQ